MAYVITPPTRQQIKTELDNDPTVLGYAALKNAEDWNALSALINDPTRVAGVNRRMVQVHELATAIDAGALAALTVANRECFLFLATVAAGYPIDPFDAVTRTYFTVFASGGATGATRTRLIALQIKTGSRAEALWGDGVQVSAGDIEGAARGQF